MTEQIITRRAPLRATSWNAEKRTFDVVLSTGAPVRRRDAKGEFDEVLAIDGARFGASLPLLDSHARDSVDAKLGQVDNLKVVGRELHGRATLSQHNPKAQRIAAELTDGQTFGVSIGYAVTTWSERTNAQTQRREKIALAFDVLEASLVIIPADRHAGIRSMTTDTTQAATPENNTQAAVERAAADTLTHSFLRVGDFPAFKEIPEGGELEYGSISERAEKVRAKEYGTGIAIGRRALINDDLSALSDFSSTIALRAAADENRLAYGVLKANAALSDGKALFHADHANIAASGTSLASGVADAVAALRGQKSLDGLTLNLQPVALVVGPKQEVAARQLLATVVASKAADVNVWAGFAELIVDAEIADLRWYLFAAPAAAPVVVFGYVGGSEGPQVRTDRDFDTQAVKVAAGLDFAVGAIDHRGAYLNAGT